MPTAELPHEESRSLQTARNLVTSRLIELPPLPSHTFNRLRDDISLRGIQIPIPGGQHDRGSNRWQTEETNRR